MKVLLIDNHDSFTYNLVQQLKQSGVEVIVKSPDDIPLSLLSGFNKIMISPGPGVPSESGKLIEIIRNLSIRTSVLGVCLGHQAIAEAFGARLIKAARIYHCEAVEIVQRIPGYNLFAGLPETFSAGRYHSWVVDPSSLPDELEITAHDPGSEVMGLRHRRFRFHGVQFHPESIMTPEGAKIIKNWIEE